MNHSIKFPLPFEIHLGFVIFSAVMMILCYKRRRHAYEMYMLIGIVSTLLVYIAEPRPVFYALGLEEILLLIMTVADMIIVSRREAAKEKALEEKQEAEEAAAVTENAVGDTSVQTAAAGLISDNSVDEILSSYGFGSDNGNGENAALSGEQAVETGEGSLSFDTDSLRENGYSPEVSGDIASEPDVQPGEILYPYEPENGYNTEVSGNIAGEPDKQPSEILYPYEPENGYSTEASEDISSEPDEQPGEILYPYEPETGYSTEASGDISSEPDVQPSEILYPYEPETGYSTEVSEDISSEPDVQQGEILYPYEPVNGYNTEVSGDISSEPDVQQGEDGSDNAGDDVQEEAYIPAHAVDESVYMPKQVKVVRRAKEPQKPPERAAVSYDVDSLLAQFEKQRDRKSYDISDINMPTLDEILAEHRRKKGGRRDI